MSKKAKKVVTVRELGSPVKLVETSLECGDILTVFKDVGGLGVNVGSKFVTHDDVCRDWYVSGDDLQKISDLFAAAAKELK